jgi:hypothetical protein
MCSAGPIVPDVSGTSFLTTFPFKSCNIC